MTTTPTASPELLDLETLRKIGVLITTQDNRITDQPMFIVQQRRRMYGLDTGYCENFIWLCSEDEYNEASADEADALEAEYQDTGRVKDGWQRTGYIDQWEFVTACFTEQGCIDYLKLDGHNLNEPRIYAEGSYRNEEFRAVRNSLIALARRAQPEGEAPPRIDEAVMTLLIGHTKLSQDGIDDYAQHIARILDRVAVVPAPDGELLPEGEAPQADGTSSLRGALMAVDGQLCAILNGADGSVYSKLKAARNDLVRIWLPMGGPAATLSPLCGAQHAESGKESVRQHEAIEAAVDQCYPKQDSPHASVNDKIGAARLAFRKGYRAALAAQQAAAPAVQPAQEQASMTRVTETKRAQLEARGYEIVGYVMQNSVNELCTLAHGRVEWLGKGTVTDFGTSAPGTPEAPKGSIGDLTEFHVLLNWYDNEASYGSLNEGRNKLTEYIDKWASQRAAQLDGGQEGSGHA